MASAGFHRGVCCDLLGLLSSMDPDAGCCAGRAAGWARTEETGNRGRLVSSPHGGQLGLAWAGPRVWGWEYGSLVSHPRPLSAPAPSGGGWLGETKQLARRACEDRFPTPVLPAPGAIRAWPTTQEGRAAEWALGGCGWRRLPDSAHALLRACGGLAAGLWEKPPGLA